MSVTIALHLPVDRVPTAAHIAEAVRTTEPTFRFDGEFDLNADDGTCPCKFGRKACGFEWSLDAPQDGEAAVRVATLSYRSSLDDAKAAIVVAAHLAVLTGATLLAPDGADIAPSAALAWASGQLRELRQQARERKKFPKVPPEETARAWLDAIRGHEVTFLFHADPDIGIRYATAGKEVILRARRWIVVDRDGREAGTAHLPRHWTTAQAREYPATFEKLKALLGSGPVEQATLDASDWSISITHPGGTLRVLPKPSHALSREDELFLMFDRWSLGERDVKSVSVVPNDELSGLEYRS